MNLQMAEDLADAAQATATEFSALNRTIVSFTDEFQSFAVTTQPAIQAEIDNLIADMDELQTQIDEFVLGKLKALVILTVHSYTTAISVLAGAIGVELFAGLVIGALLPVTMPFVVGAGLVLITGESIAWGVLDAKRSGNLSIAPAHQSAS
jgi:hypothetical protein